MTRLLEVLMLVIEYKMAVVNFINSHFFLAKSN